MADVAVTTDQDAVGDLDFPGDIYFDFDGVGDLDLFPDAPFVVDPSPGPVGAMAERMPSQVMNDIERFLMEEGGDIGEDEQPLPEDFFADVLFAASDEGSVESAVSNGDAATPVENEVGGGGGGKEKGEDDSELEANGAASVSESEKETHRDDLEERGGEDEDLLSKKRRRQMRNRDSAMKSRERKKMYVRDLEIKSKFLESECRRLQHALHCCAAENMALRQCLHRGKALGAPSAKQESAVLFVESLLLGSLFWLMSIVCLYLMPLAPVEIIKNASGVLRIQTPFAGAQGPRSEKPGPGLGLGFAYKKRKCKALRTKMKICLFPLDMFLGLFPLDVVLS